MRLLLKAWRILGSFWSSVDAGVLKTLVLKSAEECCSSRIGGFAIKNGRQAGKEQFPSSVSFYLGCHWRYHLYLGYVLPHSNTVIKKILHDSAQHHKPFLATWPRT